MTGRDIITLRADRKRKLDETDSDKGVDGRKATASSKTKLRSSGHAWTSIAAVPNPGLKPNQQIFEGSVLRTSSFVRYGKTSRCSYIRSEELQAIYPGQDAVVSHNECHWVESMDLQKGDAVHFQLWPFDGDRPKAMRVVRDGPAPTPAAPSSSS